MAKETDEKPKKRTTLFEKISARLLLVGVLPLAVLAAITVALLFLSYRGTNAVFEQTVLDLKRTETERFLLSTINDFRIVVDPAAAGADGVLDAVQQETLITTLFGAHTETLEELSFLHSVPAVRIASEGAETARCVTDAETERGFVCSVLGGAIDASAPLRERGEEQLFRTLTRQGAAVYIGPVVWSESGVPIVEFGVPIVLDIGDSSIISTVVAGRLRIDAVRTIFADAGFGGSGAVLLLDREGRVLAHSGVASLVGRQTETFLQELQAELIASPENISVTAIRSRAFGEGVAFTTILPLNLGATQWFVVAEWPLGDAFLEVLLVGSLLFVVWIVLLFAVRFVGRHFSRSIVTPIRAVQRRAEEIGRGDFSKKLELNTRDELEDLGKSLNEMAEDLQRLEQVRSAETRAQALAVAVQKEHQLEEEKDTLLATASHQFRTPVTALNWNISLLRTKELPGDVTELVDGIAEHSKNLAAIASDLLNATAFGAGYRAEPDEQPLNLQTLLEDILEDEAKRLTEAGLQLVKQFPPEPLTLRGSTVALRTALLQLVSNAVTYSNSGGTVTIALAAPDAHNVVVTVKDTGIGIPADEQQNLFNPFFRAKNAIVKKNVGTGLGLYIANNIVTGHGGRIGVESTEGEGTTISAWLPTSAGPAPQEEPTA